jgi:hypothetical protein
MLWNGLSTPSFAGLLIARREGFVVGGFVLAVDALEAATRLAPASEVGVAGVGDAPERGGSEFRHDAVRESVSQFFHAQMVSSE